MAKAVFDVSSEARVEPRQCSWIVLVVGTDRDLSCSCRRRRVSLSGSVLRVVRKDVESPDAYDVHAAVVTVDGQKVGRVPLGEEVEFSVAPGSHEVGVRLGANFGTATTSIDAPDGGTVVLTCEKAHPARSQVLHPSHYWRLSVGARLALVAELVIPMLWTRAARR